jgi:hypothetical protein
MQPLRIMTLDLRAPLAEDGIVSYGLDPERAGTPEPAAPGYLDPARRTSPASIASGKYLFAQTKGALEEATIAEMGIELQKEGLWRALSLEPTLFVRVLTEEEGVVTQLMRPIRA